MPETHAEIASGALDFHRSSAAGVSRVVAETLACDTEAVAARRVRPSATSPLPGMDTSSEGLATALHQCRSGRSADRATARACSSSQAAVCRRSSETPAPRAQCGRDGPSSSARARCSDACGYAGELQATGPPSRRSLSARGGSRNAGRMVLCVFVGSRWLQRREGWPLRYWQSARACGSDRRCSIWPRA
jgi:hypothetical protein